MPLLQTFSARRLQTSLLYNKKDISADISEHLVNVSYSDVISGEADDLQITLEDRAGLWSGPWLPEKGATLEATWTTRAWESLSDLPQQWRLGLFEIDEISCSLSPATVTVKAASVPNNNELRGIERTRSWEKATLKKIAQDIADGAGLKLVYDTAENPRLNRTEQAEQSDLAFLSKLCVDHGLALKVHDGQIVVFDEMTYEQAEPVITILKPGTKHESKQGMTYIDSLTAANIVSKTRDIYKACHVKYQNKKRKILIETTFNDPVKTSGKILQINEQVESVAEAERLAKKRLREKNSEEFTASINCLGNFKLLAAATVFLSGFGQFDGKYIITRATHNYSASEGYTTQTELRRCLNGY